MTTIEMIAQATRTLTGSVITLVHGQPRRAGDLLSLGAAQILAAWQQYNAEHPDIPDEPLPPIPDALNPPPDRAAYLYTPDPDCNRN